MLHKGATHGPKLPDPIQARHYLLLSRRVPDVNGTYTMGMLIGRSACHLTTIADGVGGVLHLTYPWVSNLSGFQTFGLQPEMNALIATTKFNLRM